MVGKKLRIGLFGFGVVGQGLYDVIHKSKGINAEIVKICVKHRKKPRPIGMENFTFNKDELLEDKSIDVIVELIDHADEAFEIVSTAMKNSKAVVSANKKMIAEHLSELYQLQKKYDVPFLYEASVCGAIPIIRNLEEYYDNDLLDAVDAICNGTTNYILTKISEEALPYSEALRQAQILGFAESNPALDVQAFDPKYKLNILILHTFGLFVPHDKILNYGIEHLNECDATYAREKGLKIKLIAQTAKKGNNVTGFVMPKFVSKESLFFGVRNEFNAVQLSAAFSEKQFLLGKGAGSFPTASAVLSDISALSHHYRYEYKKVGQNGKLEFSNEEIISVYMRYQNRDDVHQIKFESIDEEFRSPKHRYVTGTVKIKHLLDAGLNDRKDIFVCAL